MLMTHLREETRSYHRRLERCPLLRGLAGAELSHRYYVAMLGVNYGFYAPIEARLMAAGNWWALDFDLEARLKTPLIEADLACFGIDGELLRALPQFRSVPRIPDLYAALGSMYVTEGATLGGSLIARQLAMTLALDPRSGAAFFNSYGALRVPMWKSFGAFLEQHGRANPDAVIAAASATFAAIEAWYHESYQAIASARLCPPWGV